MSAAGELAGRHALVTGAGRGIGVSIARRLARAGARLTLVGRSAAPLQALADELRAGGTEVQCATADIARRDAVDAAFTVARAGFGRVDVLVNNAGQAASAPITKRDDQTWNDMLGVNLSGTYYCMQAALPEMIKNNYGRIVNVASTAGLTGYAYVAAYCAAKHGVVGLTRAVAREVATRNVTVNAVCPGYTDTDIVQSAARKIAAVTGRSQADAVQAMTQTNPQGRLVRPEEVAHTVAWLCLPGTESVTGQSIVVAGGELM